MWLKLSTIITTVIVFFVAPVLKTFSYFLWYRKLWCCSKENFSLILWSTRADVEWCTWEQLRSGNQGSFREVSGSDSASHFFTHATLNSTQLEAFPNTHHRHYRPSSWKTSPLWQNISRNFLMICWCALFLVWKINIWLGTQSCKGPFQTETIGQQRQKSL